MRGGTPSTELPLAQLTQRVDTAEAHAYIIARAQRCGCHERRLGAFLPQVPHQQARPGADAGKEDGGPGSFAPHLVHNVAHSVPQVVRVAHEVEAGRLAHNAGGEEQACVWEWGAARSRLARVTGGKGGTALGATRHWHTHSSPTFSGKLCPRRFTTAACHPRFRTALTKPVTELVLPVTPCSTTTVGGWPPVAALGAAQSTAKSAPSGRCTTWRSHLTGRLADSRAMYLQATVHVQHGAHAHPSRVP